MPSASFIEIESDPKFGADRRSNVVPIHTLVTNRKQQRNTKKSRKPSGIITND
jgi:hypothetical protein